MNPAFVSGNDEDVHSFVERQLVERVGDAGRRLHTGRSRNEQVSLDLRLYLRRRIPLLQRAVAAVVEALAAQAASAGDALMPSFTHFRPVQCTHGPNQTPPWPSGRAGYNCAGAVDGTRTSAQLRPLKWKAIGGRVF